MANLTIILSSTTLVLFLMTVAYPMPSQSAPAAQQNFSGDINSTDPQWRMMTGGRLASQYTFYQVSIIYHQTIL